MKRLLVGFALAVSGAFGVITTTYGATGTSAYPVNAYVQRGLVMQFDAIDNVGTGTHDATATVWKDLVSANAGAYDMTLTSYGSWNANALVANGKGAGATGAVPTDLSVRTMEGCYTLDEVVLSANSVIYSSGLHGKVTRRDTGATDDKMLWHIAILDTWRGVVFGGYCDQYWVERDNSGLHTVCWNKDDAVAFQNGTNLTSRTLSNGWAPSDKRPDSQTVGSMGSGNELKCPVKMHAIRFYDRKLTTEEIALNANLDQVRFNDVDPATLTWPTGYRGREGYGLECVVSVSNNVLRGSIEVNGEDIGEFYEAWTAIGAGTVAIQAKAKPGYRFVRWEDLWDVLTDDQRVSPSITVTTDRALILTAVYTLDLPAHAYQQRGLIMQFDGIDNVGTGTHDSNATVWKDLIAANAGAYDMTLTTYGSWTANALYANGRAAGATGTVPTGLSPRTMEVSFDGSTGWSGIIYSSGIHANVKNKDTGVPEDKMLWHVAPFSGSVVFGGNCNAFAPGPDHSGLQTLCWIKNAPAGYQNGTNLTMQGISKGYGCTAPRITKQTVGAMGIGSVDSSIPGVVTMYEIRFYDRMLSADEIAFNSNIDKIRFEDANPATLTWPKGYRYLEGAGIEYAIKVSADTHGGFTVNGEDGGESYEGWFLFDADEVTITAVPEPGYHFVCWEGEGLSDAERLQVTISGVNRVQLDIKPVFAFGSSDLYLTKGLTMQFDAIDNVGTGTHDLTAAKWKDLVSANAGAYDMTVTANGSWNDNALVANGSGAGAKGASPTALAVRTMEGCYTLDIKSLTDSKVLYSSGLYEKIGDGTKMIWNIAMLKEDKGVVFGGNVETYEFGSDYSGFHTLCWIRENKEAFQNGTNLTIKSTSAGWVADDNRKDMQTVGALGKNVPLAVKMHAIRFYDRKLTADEVAFNANVDQVRFNEVDPATLTWPAGISYNAESARLEVGVTVTYDESKGRILVNGAEVRSGVATTVPYGNGMGVVTFAPAAKSYRFVSIRIGESEPIPTVDQTATVPLFDVRAFKAKIGGGGLILLVK